MKLKDLPDSADVTKIKVRLSDALYNVSSLRQYGIKAKDVYLVGPIMGDWFVKTNLNSSKIYPMFRDSISWDELKELEVVE